MKKVIAFVAVVVCFSVATAKAQGGGGGPQRTPEEMAARTKERIKAIGGLTDVQVDSAAAVYLDQSYRALMGNFREMSQEDRAAKMKEIAEMREKRLVKAGFAAELAKKVVEAMSQRQGGGGRPGGGRK